MITCNLKQKSIPSLELQALVNTAELVTETHQELTGESSLFPIKVSKLRVFTDNLLIHAWLNSFSRRFDKMQHKFVFVQNRLEKINVLCDMFPIEFSFIAGIENPADCLTRSMSYKLLIKTNLFKGPPFLHGEDLPSNASKADTLTIIIPQPEVKVLKLRIESQVMSAGSSESLEHLISPDNFPAFTA